MRRNQPAEEAQGAPQLREKLCRLKDVAYEEDLGDDENPTFSTAIMLQVIDLESRVPFIIPLHETDVRKLTGLPREMTSKEMIDFTRWLEDNCGRNIRLLIPDGATEVTPEVIEEWERRRKIATAALEQEAMGVRPTDPNMDRMMAQSAQSAQYDRDMGEADREIAIDEDALRSFDVDFAADFSADFPVEFSPEAEAAMGSGFDDEDGIDLDDDVALGLARAPKPLPAMKPMQPTLLPSRRARIAPRH